MIARAIHNLSKRQPRSFVKLNCAAIPTGLLESELFGHEKGAFTGAIAQRIGRFELANQGTVFLDEIGEIPARVATEASARSSGARVRALGKLSHTAHRRAFDRRHKPRFGAMVRDQKFREDLFYRLNVFPFTCRLFVNDLRIFLSWCVILPINSRDGSTRRSRPFLLRR